MPRGRWWTGVDPFSGLGFRARCRQRIGKRTAAAMDSCQCLDFSSVLCCWVGLRHSSRRSCTRTGFLIRSAQGFFTGRSLRASTIDNGFHRFRVSRAFWEWFALEPVTAGDWGSLIWKARCWPCYFAHGLFLVGLSGVGGDSADHRSRASTTLGSCLPLGRWPTRR